MTWSRDRGSTGSWNLEPGGEELQPGVEPDWLEYSERGDEVELAEVFQHPRSNLKE